MGMYYWDPTYLLVIIGMLLCMGASAMVNSAMNRYSKVRNARGMTGAEAARQILNNEGLYNVQIECLPSDSGDHYDPRTNTVRLSAGNYNHASVTAVGVAAHECGHAIQDNVGYSPLRLRAAFVPLANLGSNLSWPLILIGLFIGMTPFIEIGIWMFVLAVLFQLITLPVEFNASRRAVGILEQSGILQGQEIASTRKVLRAAAMTYVAAAAASILQLLRLVILFGGRRRND